MHPRSSFRPDTSRLSFLPILMLAVTLTVMKARATDLDALVFGSLDGGAATFVSAGAKIWAGSLTKDGLVALAIAGGGLRDERIACGCGRNYTTRHETATYSASVGYQWVVPEGVVAVFLGGETVLDRFGSASPSTRRGLRLQAEAWLRPTEATLVTATLVAGSARGDLWARIGWGHRWEDAYLGPETSVYLDAAGDRKLAIGLHGTDLAVAGMRLRLSAGMQWETRPRTASPYVALSVWSPW